MFQFAAFASRPYGFRSGYSLRSGFPHSDICGSMLVCQLPAAFRRLSRPSSPVIAKASTTCTSSLDPIALHPQDSHLLSRVATKPIKRTLLCCYSHCSDRQNDCFLLLPEQRVELPLPIAGKWQLAICTISDAITTLCVIRISSHRRDRILLTASELLKIDTADAPDYYLHRSGLLSILASPLHGARCSAIKTAGLATHTYTRPRLRSPTAATQRRLARLTDPRQLWWR
jgi:hypothetical protein